MSVRQIGDGLDYVYVVTTIISESGAGGGLLDSLGRVVVGDRADGSRGPCEQSFSETRGSPETVTFTCNNASAPVAFIRVLST
jgi:hypothetical protein